MRQLASGQVSEVPGDKKDENLQMNEMTAEGSFGDRRGEHSEASRPGGLPTRRGWASARASRGAVVHRGRHDALLWLPPDSADDWARVSCKHVRQDSQGRGSASRMYISRVILQNIRGFSGRRN